MKLATITEIFDDGVRLQVDGEDTPTSKHYKCADTFKPIVNQRVCIEQIGGSGDSRYVVTGTVGNPRQNTTIADITAATPTATDCKNKINELLAALRLSGTID